MQEWHDGPASRPFDHSVQYSTSGYNYMPRIRVQLQIPLRHGLALLCIREYYDNISEDWWNNNLKDFLSYDVPIFS